MWVKEDDRAVMSTPKHIDLTQEESRALLERVQAVMSPEDHELITGIVETLAMMSQALEEKNMSIGRLRRMVFGATTESSKNLFPDEKPSSDRSKRGKKKKKGFNPQKEKNCRTLHHIHL